ncbi:hypothetical protein HU200_012111 [Digitaria exilis]|uniref:VQ domain-containing protein n=1 Tax=Digitaria exilis TaxID=1010633 RepID=A0A835KNK3_9POAL|nr:hypothetical protein HU200_012111 [Digitaria exilis]
MPHQQQHDPNSPSSSTSSSSSSSTSPSHPHHRAQPHNLPPSPRPIPRTIETTPFPTTFVQADTTSFKQVVQMLTGAEPPITKNDQTTTATAGNSGGGGGQAAAGGPCRPKKPSFKLYERRSSMKNLKMIAPLAMGPPPSPRRATAPEILSPSVLDFPSLRLSSPVTPLAGDPFSRGSPASTSSEEAERAAIAERGFFLHPSPRGAADPPRLLPLFPVTSPRMAASAAAPSE